MRRKKIWLALLATAMVAGSASAGIIDEGGNFYTYEGNGFEFFTYNNDSGSLTTNTWDYTKVATSNGVYRSAGNQGDGIWTTNAAPYQTYDFEEAFWAYVGDETGGTLHIGLVVGQYDADGIPYNNSTSTNGDMLHNAGDLFIGLGSNASYQYAIGLSTGTGTNNRIGNSWENDSTPLNWSITAPTDFPASSPWRVAESQLGLAPLSSGQTGFGTVDWSENGLPSGNRHNFVAVAIDIEDAFAESLIGEFGGLSFHWTMECGNDIITVSQGRALAPVPVPAAAPMGLLGMVALGLFRKVRAKKS